MASLPSSSLRSIPPRKGRKGSQNSDNGSPQGRSFPAERGYGSTNDDREGSNSSLVPPIIDDSDIEVEGGGYMRRNNSLDSVGKKRARSAANALQGRAGGLEMASNEDEWFEIANPARRREHLTSDLQTFIHLLKGNVGTGLLAMPLAVKNAGYILGPLGLLVLGCIATHCMLLLVKCSQKLSRKHQVDSLNYAEVMKFAIIERTSTPLFGTIGLTVVNTFLTITQFGFCAVYFVFIGDSLSRVAHEAFGVVIDDRIGIAIILPLIILCSWIRELDSLTPFSFIANLCILFSLAVIFYEIMFQMIQGEGEEKAAVRKEHLHAFNFAKFPLYFGSAVYAFEGIGVVLPLENKMEKPHHFKRIIILGMLVIVTTYLLFGLLGYLVYGSGICPSVTLNLRSSTRIVANTIFLIVVLYYAYVIFASYMIQFYVPMDFLEIPFFRLIRVDNYLDRLLYSHPHLHGPVNWLLRTLFRTVVVIITAAFAVGIPDLDGLISLIGAFASAALAFIFPPLLQLLTFWQEKPPFLTVPSLRLSLPWPVTVVKCVIILLIGVVGSITGTIFSIISIVDFFENDSKSCPPT